MCQQIPELNESGVSNARILTDKCIKYNQMLRLVNVFGTIARSVIGLLELVNDALIVQKANLATMWLVLSIGNIYVGVLLPPLAKCETPARSY